VLAYHRFDATRPGPTTITLDVLHAQFAWLDAHHYRVVPLHEALAALPQVNHRYMACITVDDGHRSVYTHLFPLIRERGLPVTLFVYPSAISNAHYALTWEQLREMRATGLVDVQSHTYWHPNFVAERLRRTTRDFQVFVDDQLRRSRQVIEKRLASHVDLLAWPYGYSDAELQKAATNAGYVAAFAYGGGPLLPGDAAMALPRIPVGQGDRGNSFGARLQLRTPQRGE